MKFFHKRRDKKTDTPSKLDKIPDGVLAAVTTISITSAICVVSHFLGVPLGDSYWEFIDEFGFPPPSVK